MLHQTKGIVLHAIKYGDSGLIVKIYTQKFGLQSYMVNGARGKKSTVKVNLLQPLSLLDMVVYYREQKQLQRIKELKIDFPFTNIPQDIVKRSIALFVSEILHKSIKEEEADSGLFQFLRSALEILDLKAYKTINFHLLFLVRLSKYLGFFPHGNFSAATPFFNLVEGVYQYSEPLHPYCIGPPLSKHLSLLLSANFESLPAILIGNEDRKILLKKLIEYYELHLPNVKKIQSHLVLEDVVAA